MGFQISGKKPAIFWVHSWSWMPPILNTCEHNKEITNYLQVLPQNGIQEQIAHTAEGLPCLLFLICNWTHFGWLYKELLFVLCQQPGSCCTIIHCINMHLFQQYPAPTPAHFVLWLSHSFTKEVGSCREVCGLQYSCISAHQSHSFPSPQFVPFSFDVAALKPICFIIRWMRGSEAVVSEVPGLYIQKKIRIISEKLEHQHWQTYILQGSPKTWE